mgnify:CR=1 FL=1
MDAYHELAGSYDRLTNDVDYDATVDFYYEILGRELKVSLKKGGKDILLSANCDKAIERIIKGLFGVDYTVSFSQGEDFNTELALDSMQKKADEEIRREKNIPEPSVPAESGEPKPHVIKEGFPLFHSGV